MLYVYTDGACSGNGSKNATGGWGYVILRGEMELLSILQKGQELNDKLVFVCEDSGFENDSTNQRMELTAALNGCRAAEQISKETGEAIVVISDSAYLINCKNQKWYKGWRINGWINSKKQPVANKELWVDLMKYFDSPYVFWIKVKGHANNKWNEYVDKLAVRAIMEKNNGKSCSY